MGRRYIDLTGQVINDVIVKGLVQEEGKAGKHKRWYCICPICSKTFIVPSQHLRDKSPISMCFQCSIKQYDDLTGKKFGRLTVIERDQTSKGKRVRFKCRCGCGSTVSVRANHLKSGKILSCGCLISSGEERIGKYLSEHGIRFEKQKQFDGCMNKFNLRFDFYLPDINAVIEYQGVQHFQPIKFFGGDKALADTKKRDKIKRMFCFENNIKLFTISYNESIEEKLKYILSNEDIVYPCGNAAG